MFLSCERNPAKLCDKSNQHGSLRVHLDLNVGDEDFELYKEYKNHDSIRFRVSDFIFYLQLKAITEKGDTLKCLNNAKLFDLDDVLRDEYRDYSIPKGNYSKLLLSVGLDTSLNSKDPSDYQNDDDLSLFRGTYWSWAMGYKFFAMEGHRAMSAEDTTDLRNTILIHIGLDECHREKLIEKTFSIEKEGLTEMNLKLDLLKIFDGANQIDLNSQNYTQSANSSELALSILFIENIINAVELD